MKTMLLLIAALLTWLPISKSSPPLSMIPEACNGCLTGSIDAGPEDLGPWRPDPDSYDCDDHNWDSDFWHQWYTLGLGCIIPDDEGDDEGDICAEGDYARGQIQVVFTFSAAAIDDCLNQPEVCGLGQGAFKWEAQYKLWSDNGPPYCVLISEANDFKLKVSGPNTNGTLTLSCDNGQCTFNSWYTYDSEPVADYQCGNRYAIGLCTILFTSDCDRTETKLSSPQYVNPQARFSACLEAYHGGG